MDRSHRRSLPLLLIILLIAGPSAALAQTKTAEAEQLFRDGKRLMKERAYAEACDAFDASFKLDPAVTTLMNLADCREKNQELATAWGHFLDVERLTRTDRKNASLAKTSHTRAAALEKRLSFLTVSVPDEARVAGLIILRNGAELDEGLWNRALPIDGGAWVVAGRAPGHEEWTTTLQIAVEGGRASVDVPRFKELLPLVEAEAPAGEPGADDEAVEVVDGDEEEEAGTPSRWTGRRKVAVAVAGLGVLTSVTSGVLGMQARDLADEASATCPGNPCSELAAANALYDRAERRGLYANVGYVVGGLAIAGAAVLWLTGAPETDDPDRVAVTPQVSGGFAGMAVSGRF